MITDEKPVILHGKQEKNLIKMHKYNIGVLFDLDGVLLDTEGIYSKFWGAVDEQYPTHVENFTEVIKGSNLHKILHEYFPNDEVRTQVTTMLDDFQKDMSYDFFPGALKWIQLLHEAHIPMCVVTSSDQKKMEAVYRQHPEFRGYFKDVVVGEMVQKPKPDPECFLLGAKLIQVDIAHCYVFEDSINGLNSAMASGAKVIGLSTTNPATALEGKAHLIIDNFQGFTIDKMLKL